MKFNKICICLKPFLNGLSFFLGVLFLGLVSCSITTDSTLSDPIKDTTPPTVTISTNESLAIGKTGTITFAFDEEVNGFTKDDVKLSSSDFSLSDITIISFITNTAKEYSLNITPKLVGTLTVTVQTNSFEDLSSNQNTNSFSTNFLVKEDKTPPNVAISTKENLETGKTGTITFAFSENVTNFTPDDIQFLPTGFSVEKGKFVTNNQKSYSLQITPKEEGTLTITIPTNSFYDLSSNQNTNSFSTNFSVKDKTPPTVTISTNESLAIGKTGTITFAFDEEVNGFTKDDVKLSSSDFSLSDITIISFITNTAKEYSLNINPKLTGTLTVTVQTNSFEDLSSNQNTNSFSTNFSVEDKTPPTVAISTNESLAIGKTGTITFTFDEEVNGFTKDDVQLSSSDFSLNDITIISFITNTAKEYSLNINPKLIGTLTVTVQANSFEDLSGNQNTDNFSTNFSVEDKTPPTVAISTNESLAIGKTGTITFTFDEEVNGFTKDDIKLSSSDFSLNDITIISFITNTTKEYSLNINPKLIGTLTVTVQANSFEDLSSNQNTDSFSTNFSVEDKTPPTVAISTNESLAIGKTGTITFTFDEEVNGFTKDDIKLSSSDFSLNDITIISFITNTAKEYSLNINPKLIGTLTVTVQANSFEDLSSNQNTDSFSTNFWVRDNIPPTVAISTNESLAIGKTGTITFTFDEEVNGFTKDDIKLSSSDFSLNDITIISFITNTAKEYSLNINPKLIGTLTVTVQANSFEDLSGNQNTDNFSTNFSVEDKTPPTVAISTNESLAIGKTGTITFTFDEEVNGFTKDDVKLSSSDFSLNDITIISFITNTAKEYSLNINPKLIGTLTVTVQANSFEDLSGNQNTDNFSTNFSVEDKTPPTVAISTNESLAIGKTGTITFTFDEEVNGFTKDDVKLSSSDFSLNDITIISFITNTAKEYSLNINPKLIGTLTVTVQANSFEDLSSNQNTDSFSTNFSVEDKTPPTVAISTNEFLGIDITGTITFTFDEEVNGFTKDDVQLLMNGVSVDKSNFVTNNQKSYSLQITPKAIGTLHVSIPANSFEDLSSNKNNKSYSNAFTVFPTYTISFKLNGGSFISPQITSLKVVDNTAIEKTQLEKILSYPPTGPKPGINAVTRGIFEWRNNEIKYELSTPVSSDLTLEAVWSNSCGKIETFHPANTTQLKTYTDKAITANSTTNLNHINTSAITDMYRMFYRKTTFNGEIDCWNTTKVTNMSYMFRYTTNFNQNIGSWDVSKVNNMREMFKSSFLFNQNIGSWDVSKVNNMKEMFRQVYAFNQDISSWDVANVTDMNSMFSDAYAFNQDISKWNVANVNNMRRAFRNAYAFNQDISKWNVANVTDMSSMFSYASSFNQNIGSWNVAKVNNMSFMFSDASSFNQNISTWGVSNVTDMRSMFSNASSFDQDISSWPVSNVTIYDHIFTGSAMESKTSQQPTFP